MNQDWQQFLTQQGAVLDAGLVQHFGDAAAELRATAQGAVLCDLGQFGILRASGEDAQTFLQNMLSNDIREVTADRAQLSSLNTPKGRMLASMLIWRSGDDYLLQLPRALCEPMRRKLSMYVLRAKVKTCSAGEDVVRLGVAGAAAEDSLREIWGMLPQNDHDVVRGVRGVLIRLPGGRFEAVVKAEDGPDLWHALSRSCMPVGSPCWEWLDIRAGIPAITQATQEQFVPQMVNLEAIGGVSFQKGCYPGQEIVARTMYLGKVKRRMYLANIPGEFAPLPGDELFGADAEAQPSGMIVNAQPSPDGGFDVLAVIQTASAEAGSIHWKSQDGPVLRLLPLPYPI